MGHILTSELSFREVKPIFSRVRSLKEYADPDYRGFMPCAHIQGRQWQSSYRTFPPCSKASEESQEESEIDWPQLSRFKSGATLSGQFDLSPIPIEPIRSRPTDFVPWKLNTSNTFASWYVPYPTSKHLSFSTRSSVLPPDQGRLGNSPSTSNLKEESEAAGEAIPTIGVRCAYGFPA